MCKTNFFMASQLHLSSFHINDSTLATFTLSSIYFVLFRIMSHDPPPHYREDHEMSFFQWGIMPHQTKAEFCQERRKGEWILGKRNAAAPAISSTCEIHNHNFLKIHCNACLDFQNIFIQNSKCLLKSDVHSLKNLYGVFWFVSLLFTDAPRLNLQNTVWTPQILFYFYGQ